MISRKNARKTSIKKQLLRVRFPGQLLTYVFNFFEADDCHCCTSNHEAHVDNEEKMEKFVTQRTLRESPMRNLKKKRKFSWNQSIADTVWRNEKITLSEKIFREIKSLVKTSLSRIFCQNNVKANSMCSKSVRNIGFSLSLFFLQV